MESSTDPSYSLDFIMTTPPKKDSAILKVSHSPLVPIPFDV
jgi:hypothetical protein